MLGVVLGLAVVFAGTPWVICGGLLVVTAGLTVADTGFLLVVDTGLLVVVDTGFFVVCWTTGLLLVVADSILSGLLVVATGFLVVCTTGFLVVVTGFLVVVTGFLVVVTGFFVVDCLTLSGRVVGWVVVRVVGLVVDRRVAGRVVVCLAATAGFF